MVFDWDNTLIDSWPAIFDAQNHTLAHFGLATWTWDEMRERVRKSMRDSFPELFGEAWEEAGRVFYERFAERHLETLTPLPGAAHMLENLAASGIWLGVVSNKKGDFLRKEARHLGWDRHFKSLVGALDAERDKPAVEPVAMALEGSGLSPGREVWFVGDTDIDMECAINSGCLPVLMRAEAAKPGEFDKFQPELTLRGCLALSNLIGSL